MINTNVTGKYVSSSKDFLSQKAKTNASRKSSELDVAHNNENDSKVNKEDFNKVLNSKANSKDQDTEKVVDKTESSAEVNETNTKVDELNKKLEELENDIKTGSQDDVNDVLQTLLNLLNNLVVNKDAIQEMGNVNSEDLQTLILVGTGSNESVDSKQTVLDQLIQLLKSDSAQENLGKDSLDLMEKILNQLSAKISDNSNEKLSNVKDGIKDLLSQISKIVENKQDKNEKVITLEDILNQKYSQNKDSNNEKTEVQKDSKKVSKEDKFLNSLLDDNKDSSLQKINLFASRTQVAQGQGAEGTGQLTINKATFANDLIKDIKFMSNNGLKELSVKVNPGNLGEITISLSQEDGVMKANLKANSKETVALLSQSLNEIKEKLIEQNIKVSDVNIELYQEDTTFFREGGFGSQLSQEQGKNSENSNNGTNNDVEVKENSIENITNNNNNNLDFLA